MPFISHTKLREIQSRQPKRAFRLKVEFKNMSGIFTPGTILYLGHVTVNGSFHMDDGFGNGLIVNVKSLPNSLEELTSVELEPSPEYE